MVLQTTLWLPNTHTKDDTTMDQISNPVGDDTPTRPKQVSGSVARRYDLALSFGNDDDRDGARLCEAVASHAY